MCYRQRLGIKLMDDVITPNERPNYQSSIDENRIGLNFKLNNVNRSNYILIRTRNALKIDLNIRNGMANGTLY